MATYYQHGAQETQQEGQQTLYLMNPGYPGYAGAPGAASANILLLNSAASLNPLSHSNAAHIATNNPQQFLGIPLQPTAPAPVPNTEISSHQPFSSTTHATLWGSAMSPQLGLRHHQQGLSLSLSPQQTPYVPAPEMPPARIEEVRIPIAPSSATWLSNGLSGFPCFWVGSKYLKVAQQLLDEVISVGDGIKGESQKICESKSQLRSSKEAESGKEERKGAKQVAELTTAERQELQIKSAKLVNMLEEVEQRYKQYHNQMQIVVSSFETAAGIGAARTYTALALQTISKQFRGLRDTISVQIRATAKILGEEGSLGGDKFQGSRLRFMDHQNRQQRALQQIGMIQQNAWRPQRGLPERSVSILRAWLFEHFLHPYPKDSDKQMLAKQTGLTRSQVSNWFINARVRLWKPMVEEMYLEELKGEEQNNQDDKRSKISNTNSESTSKSNANPGISSEGTEQTNQQLPVITLPHSGLLDGNQELGQLKPKRVRSNESMQSNTVQHSMNIDFVSKDMESQGYSFLTRKMSNGDIDFSGYSIGQLERFDAEQFTPRVLGKSVSLTLGLQNCENLSLSNGHPSYLAAHSIPFGRRAEIGSSNNEFCGLGNDPSVVHASNNFVDIDAQSRKRFAAYLLPDFVA